MLFGQTRLVKRELKLFPPRNWIGHDSGLFFRGEGMDVARQRPDGLLHAFVRRGQFEPRIEGLQMPPELVLQCVDGVGLRR